MRMNSLSKSIMGIFILFTPIYVLATDNTDKEPQQLETIIIKGHKPNISTLPFTNRRKVSDVFISGDKFKSRSTTLGNALANELGIHSNPFGGGASNPIIRGQEGVRIKILQNGAEAVDMSSLSPDHASVVDTLLADHVEIIRGAPTLLYATASSAGVVNVSDKRIPEKIPEKGFEGELQSRYNTNSKENIFGAGATLGIGKHIALRLEGLKRNAQNYKVPEFKLGKTLNYVPDTNSKSKVGTMGISFIGDKGFIGTAYSIRRDKYGLPGHNHYFDLCIAHPLDSATSRKLYLNDYPHLMDDEDLSLGPHFHCGWDIENEHKHDHDHPYGHNYDYSRSGPWVDLISKRLEVRGALNQPFKGLDSIKFNIARSKYYHDEKDPGKDINILGFSWFNPAKNYGRANNLFENKGINTRLDLTHTPIAGLKGTWGIQYQKQESSAEQPYAREMKHPLVHNKEQRLSFFALEQLKYKNFLLELAARKETQRIHIFYDLALLERRLNPQNNPDCFLFCDSPPISLKPDLSDYKQKANSYAGTLFWDITPHDKINFGLAHTERLATPMELYYHGQHLATNSIDLGKKNLKKERSNNFELGFYHSGYSWNYRLNAYYNRFNNYIYKEVLYKQGNLTLNRYAQSQARFHGFEFQVDYMPTVDWKFSLFGDYVRGRLVKLPEANQKVYTGTINPYTGEPDYDYLPRPQPDKDAPRVAPARLGLRANYNFQNKWDLNLDYTRVFAQHKVSLREDPTEGYHLLNLGAQYHNHFKGIKYTLALNANNVLNQKVYIHTSFLPYVPQIGRNFSIGLNAEF